MHQKPTTPRFISGCDLARRLGVSPMLVAGAHDRLCIGAFQIVEVVARRRLLVFAEAEAEAVLADLAERARGRRADDAKLIAAIEGLARRS